jgi:tetratricopeptide (TPR) repeat protein
MSIKRLLFISATPLLLVACSEFYGTQPPAPVYSGDVSSINTPPASEQTATQTQPQETASTRPLEEKSIAEKPVELKPQLSLEQEQALLERELQMPPALPEVPKAEELLPKANLPSNTELAAPAKPALIAPPPPPPPPVPAFQPLEAFAPSSPVVKTLLLAANKTSDSGNIDSATTTIERAIRIEPRNPALYYKLALLRLKQSKPNLAEDLAKKSALLATNDPQLKKHSWLLIARARDLQKNIEGAKQARDMADKF